MVNLVLPFITTQQAELWATLVKLSHPLNRSLLWNKLEDLSDARGMLSIPEQDYNISSHVEMMMNFHSASYTFPRSDSLQPIFVSKGINRLTLLLTQTSAVQEFFWPFQQEKDKNHVWHWWAANCHIATSCCHHPCLHHKTFLNTNRLIQRMNSFSSPVLRPSFTLREGSSTLQRRKSQYSLYVIIWQAKKNHIWYLQSQDFLSVHTSLWKK